MKRKNTKKDNFIQSRLRHWLLLTGMIELKGHNYLSILPNRVMCKKFNPTDKLVLKARPTPPKAETEGDVHLQSYLALLVDLNLYNSNLIYHNWILLIQEQVKEYCKWSGCRNWKKTYTSGHIWPFLGFKSEYQLPDFPEMDSYYSRSGKRVLQVVWIYPLIAETEENIHLWLYLSILLDINLQNIYLISVNWILIVQGQVEEHCKWTDFAHWLQKPKKKYISGHT